MKKKPIEENADCARRAREHTVAGGALGAASAAGLAITGTVLCPLCIVAAPALICSGLWNAHKSRQATAKTPTETTRREPCPPRT